MAERYAHLYGPICLPTLCSLMNMVADQAVKFGWDNIVLWKKDLNGAFNLLWFNPDHVPLLAFPLLDGHVAVHLAGLFGLGGLPPAFTVISRAVDAASADSLVGASSMYVDDDCGCSPLHALHADMDTAHRIMTDLLGPSAVAANKDEYGRALKFIGWLVDLDTRSVLPSPRNLLKMQHAFFSVPRNWRVTAEHVLRLASYASRLSMLHPLLRPFTRALYRDHGLFSPNPFGRRSLSQAARSDVLLWRAVLLLMDSVPLAFARPIESFRPLAPTVALAYDASLTALAVGVSTCVDHAWTLRAFTVVPLPFPTTTDSSYQNTFEYLAVLTGLLLARRLSLRHFAFHLHGDSVSSLQWAASGRAASDRARRVNIALALTGCAISASLGDTTHVPGVLNTVYDGLSRGQSASAVGLDPALQVTLDPRSPEFQLLLLCDPFTPLVTFEGHADLIADCMRLLHFPLAPNPPHLPPPLAP